MAQYQVELRTNFSLLPSYVDCPYNQNKNGGPIELRRRSNGVYVFILNDIDLAAFFKLTFT